MRAERAGGTATARHFGAQSANKMSAVVVESRPGHKRNEVERSAQGAEQTTFMYDTETVSRLEPRPVCLLKVCTRSHTYETH